MEPLELATLIARTLDDKKGIDIKLLQVGDLTVLAEYFVVVSGTSNTHVGSLADEVEYKLSEAGIEPLRTEGAKTREWVLLDYGSVVVHLFYPEARNFYALERLWADAQPVELPFLTD